MIGRRLAAAATAGAAAAMLFAGVSATAAQASVRPATPQIYGYYAYFTGTGSTAANAKQDALYTSADWGCSPAGQLIYDTQQPNGTWNAEVKTLCPNT